MKRSLVGLWKENRALLLFIGLMLMFRSSIADWNLVPTGSMKPTILEGDRILVNKMAYDIRLPFTHISLLKLAEPARGDIVIFDSEVSDKRLVKRVIGLPGDRVAMQGNMLWINDHPVDYSNLDSGERFKDLLERLPGTEHRIRVLKADSPLSSFPPVRVPAGHYLVLGDNRDNSADSRVIGFVPRKEIVGRSRQVVLSLDDKDYYLPRTDRFMQPL